MRSPWVRVEVQPHADVQLTVADVEVYAILIDAANVAKKHDDREVLMHLLAAVETVARRLCIAQTEQRPRTRWVRRKHVEQGQSEGC